MGTTMMMMGFLWAGIRLLVGGIVSVFDERLMYL